MAWIGVEHLTFSYADSEQVIFNDVTFSMDTTWKLGLIGRNGRGKTTFLKLLMGAYPYQGRISAAVSFSYFPFPIADDSLPVLQLAEEICPDAAQWQLVRELSLLQVDAEILYRPFATLSGGERTKAMLAMLFLRTHTFLLIDEPTNHLDAQGRTVVSQYLNRKQGFILVSHDRAVLDACVDHILSINKQNLSMERGNYSSWERNQQANEHFETVQQQRLKKEIQTLEAAAKRAAAHSAAIERTKIGFDPKTTEKSMARRSSVAAKSKKLMKRSKALEARVEADLAEKAGLLQNAEETAPLKLPMLQFHSKRLLEVKHLSICYGEKPVCSDVSFALHSGEILALTGKNGCGKTSVIRLICGEDIPHTGDIYQNEQLRISRIAQDFSGYAGDLSAYAALHGLEESLLKAILRKLGFSREQFTQRIADFSDGQQKKLMIATSLCTPAHLYIWDEPLNFLDIYACRQLEALIIRYRPSMLLVEHDKTFCAAIQAITCPIGNHAADSDNLPKSR